MGRFSAHDETGDDLRRRWDDPDLTTVDGRHPVVFAGAGSHSGAYLPGDYLITVAPPSWGGVIPAVRRLAKLFAPWARAAQGAGLGIPYIDYARGDGPSIGPSAKLAWDPVVIDEQTPWVRDYRGGSGATTRKTVSAASEGPPALATSATPRSGCPGATPSAGRRSPRSRPARRPRRPSSPTASTRSTSSSPT